MDIAFYPTTYSPTILSTIFDCTPAIIKSKLQATAPILATPNLLDRNDIEPMVKLAEDSETPPNILRTLSHHKDVRIRAAVADNPNIPYVSLMKLACDESHDIRYQVAENHNIPVQVISILAEDENPYIRMRAEQTLNRLATLPPIA